MNDYPEILFIDDIPNAAADFAELVRAKYKFKVIATDEPMEAIDIVKTNPIKVAVIDQRMPKMKGTDLFKKLLEINPLIKAVMLSGEADRQEVSDAYNLGYETFLEKTAIKDLPDKVFELYTKYEIDFAREIQTKGSPMVLSDIWSLFTRHSIHFHLFGIEKLKEDYVFQDKWTATVEISAGQSLEVEVKSQYEETITISQEFSQKLISEFNLSEKKFNLLSLKINKEVNDKYSLSKVNKRSFEKRTKIGYSLPAPPSDISQVYIAKTVFQVAPVFTEFRAVINKSCSFCKNYQSIPIIFYKQNVKIASRQINYRSDGKDEIIPTGINQYF